MKVLTRRSAIPGLLVGIETAPYENRWNTSETLTKGSNYSLLVAKRKCQTCPCFDSLAGGCRKALLPVDCKR